MRLRREGLLVAVLASALTLAGCGGGGGGSGGGGGLIPVIQTMTVTTTTQGPLSPFGATGGGDTLVITGTGFANGLTVSVGPNPAVVASIATNQITVTTPPGAVGFATITVVNPGGANDAIASSFQYVAPPAIISVMTQTGPTTGENRVPIAGGETIMVTGANFKTGATGALNGVPITYTFVSPTEMTFVAPAAAGDSVQSLTVTNPEGLGAQPGTLIYTQEFSLQPAGNGLGTAQARHLYRRAGFGATDAVIAQVVTQGLSATVDGFLSYTHDKTLETEAEAAYGATQPPKNLNNRSNKEWWLHMMVNNANAFQDRLAWFLHDHFATSEDGMASTFRWTLKWQVSLLRRFSMAGGDTINDGSPGLNYNWRQLIIEISKDRAMLDWLDGRLSRVGNPNENFARELWELFTLGEGNGYTENDIQEAAKALTGFQWFATGPAANRYLDIRYVRGLHDAGEKTILGQTGNFGYDDIFPFDTEDIFATTDARDTDGGVVALTFAQRPVEASTFICRKLAEFFLYDDIDDVVVDELAAALRAPGANQWNLKPILRTILTSKAMFSSRALKGKVQNPVEFGIGFLRDTGIQLSAVATTNASRIRTSLIDMGQVVINPPDVAGWPAGIAFTGSQGMLERYNFLNFAVEQLDQDAQIEALAPPAGQRSASQLVDHVADLLDVQLSGNARAKYISYLQTELSGGTQVPFAFDGNNPEHLKMKLRGLLWMVGQYHDAHQE